MAVVANLSVNLSAQTAQYSNGLEKAKKDTKGLEKQVTQTQRVMRGFNASLKGFNVGAIGGRLGLPGTLGGVLGGFTFARFAKDSLREHAKENKQLQETLTDLDASFVMIKKNFGAWMTDVAGANGILQKFNETMRNLSGENLNQAQGLVNMGVPVLGKGRLDTDQTASQLKRQLKQALDSQRVIRQQVDASRGFNWSGLAVGKLEFDAPDETLKRQFDTITAEINLMQDRLERLQKQGLDFPQFENLGGFLKNELKDFRILDADKLFADFKAFDAFQLKVKDVSKTFEPFRQQGISVFNSLKEGADAALKGVADIEAAIKRTTAGLRQQALDDAKAIIQSNKTALEQFDEQFKRLKFLKQEGFLSTEAAAAGLASLRQDLTSQFTLDPVERPGGTRRGSAEAFEKVGAFRDREQNRMENTWEQILKRAEEQAKLTKETNKLLEKVFANEPETIDTKP